MAQNIYDNPTFFAGYKHLRETASGLNEVLEQPALRALLPDLAEISVLDLGCGMGQFARYCIDRGAAQVVGVDVSERMLEVARSENAHPQIDYLRAALEDLQLPEARFDLVVSSLTLHYVEDYAGLVRKVHGWLRPGGAFLFSVEHPISTAYKPMQGWIKDAQGRILYWPVDDYGAEGRREQHWFVGGVIKYHRTIATYINTLVEAGFQIERVGEPEAVPEAVQEQPDLADQSRRPPFLIIKAGRG